MNRIFVYWPINLVEQTGGGRLFDEIYWTISKKTLNFPFWTSKISKNDLLGVIFDGLPLEK